MKEGEKEREREREREKALITISFDANSDGNEIASISCVTSESARWLRDEFGGVKVRRERKEREGKIEKECSILSFVDYIY